MSAAAGARDRQDDHTSGTASRLDFAGVNRRTIPDGFRHEPHWAVPLAAGVIVLAAVAVYWNSFAGVFVFDDWASVVENPTIRRWQSVSQCLSPPRNGETVSGRPLLNLSLAINYAVSGTRTWSYHFVNLLLHIVNALLLFGLLRRTFGLIGIRNSEARFGNAEAGPGRVVEACQAADGRRAVDHEVGDGHSDPSQESGGKRSAASKETQATRADHLTQHTAHSTLHTMLAFAIAGLWTVHPLQVEAVTYIVQRGESLASLFYLLTLYGLIRGATPERDCGFGIGGWNKPYSSFANPQSPIANRFFWYLAAMLACLLGMATKEIMLTAPVVALLYDRTFLAGSFGSALRRRWGLYLGLAATWSLLIYLVLSTGLIYRGSELNYPSWWRYALTEPKAILHYLRAALWPYPLCVYYAWPVAESWREIWPALAMVGVCGLATIWALLKRPAWGFVGAWSFLILAPTSSIIPTRDVVFDHRMYLPLAAVLTLLVLDAYTVGRSAVHSGLIRSGTARVLGLCLLAVIGVPWGMLTVARNQCYRSVIDLWQDTLSKAPNNPFAHNNLGVSLAGLGQVDAAVVHFQRAFEIQPDYAEAHINLGNTLAGLGQIEGAIAQYQEAIHIQPNYALAYNNLGNALAGRGQVEEAIVQYQKAIHIRPEFAQAHYNLGNVLAGRGRIADATDHYERALENQPDYADAHNNLGFVLAHCGQIDAAIAHYQKALHVDPRCAAAHCNLGLTLAQRGQLDEAIAHYQTALAVKPGYADARRDLALVLSERQELLKSLAQRREAIRLRPDDAALINDTAWMLATNPNASFRNGAEAVELAQRALQLSGGNEPARLGTLAAAYAEAGRFPEAVQAAQRALALAASQANSTLASTISARIGLYRAGLPYRDIR